MKTAVEILIEQLEGTLVQAVYERLENSGILTEALQLEANQIREAYKDGLISKLEYEDQHEDYFIEKYLLNKTLDNN
jgi:hypothetical protein